ncbi:hypothetical protein ABWK22_02290 [Gottfriedia acidiceleris]|uniref:TerC family protein n=1 Tax=Gottfriedia acidiceleris TaxID=371036 RepID=UPI0033925F3E
MLHNLYIVLILVIMEGLLSADNALVLSMMASKIKDPEKQKKVIYYGMVGAFAFRAIFILLGTFILKFWPLKVLGAVYLLKMAYDHFKGKDSADEDQNGIIDKYENTLFHKVLRKFGIRLNDFWTVVVSIEFMDLAFSYDSITASLALSDKFWVLALGGILGIVMMRSVAGLFTNLIKRVPEMQHTAFILIFIIGANMFAGTIHFMVNFVVSFTDSTYRMHEIEMPHWMLFTLLIGTFGMTFVVNAIRNKKVTA